MVDALGVCGYCFLWGRLTPLRQCIKDFLGHSQLTVEVHHLSMVSCIEANAA